MPEDAVVVESLVSRLCSQFDVEARDLRERAADVYAQFENVRLRTFVPVLVEKQLRDHLRLLRPSPGQPAQTVERASSPPGRRRSWRLSHGQA